MKLEHADDDDDDDDATNDDADDEYRRRQDTILELVERNHASVKPALLVQELGMSVNDASAELCALMSAVGSEASFSFETAAAAGGGPKHNTTSAPVMVFHFPPNVRNRLNRQQKQQDLKEVLITAAGVVWKLLKIVTALGLLLSLCIVSIAAVLTLIAALIAVSRDNRNAHGRNAILREIRNIIIALRQFAFLYVLWGPSSDENGDDSSSMRYELAYDFWLLSSICCGNPLFFFYRASILNQRRQRGRYRSFGRSLYRRNHRQANMWDEGEETGIEGVRLIRNGGNRWQEDGDGTGSVSDDTSSEYKGLLSVCVEFLFGPTASPKPSEAEKWKLRSALILQHASNTSISLEALSPYADLPPKSLDDTSSIVSQGMRVVSYFNGAPSPHASRGGGAPTKGTTPSPQFIFPELASEGAVSSSSFGDWRQPPEDFENISTKQWLLDILFVSPRHANTLGSSSRRRDASGSPLPPFLYEHPVSFSKLTMTQFLKAFGLVMLNAIGVYWMYQACQPPNGMLRELLGKPATATLEWTLLPLLIFYAKLFVLLPVPRLIYILAQNYLRGQRNRRRQALAKALVEEARQYPNGGGATEEDDIVVSPSQVL